MTKKVSKAEHVILSSDIQKLIKNISKIMIKLKNHPILMTGIKESSYINDWDVNNLYGWKMSQKLPVNSFKWVEETFEFNEYFIKGYNEESDERYFLEVDVQYSEKLHDLHKDLP